MFQKIKTFFNSLATGNESKDIYYCRFWNGGVTFMHNSLRACCSNKCGITFIDNYKGEKINWKKIQKERNEIIKKCRKGIIPENCKDCIELKKVNEYPKNSLIDYIYLNHWDHCNCGCVYCIQHGHALFLQTDKKPSRYYNVFNEIKYMFDNNLIAKNAHLEMIGGDLTVLEETDDIINYCLKHEISGFDFHSSCIYYSQGIENALKSNASVTLDFSLDCGSKEKYQKIKKIDAFDKVIDNVRKYIAVSNPQKDKIIAKYIIVDGFNDNIEDLDNWINIVHSLGIKYARIDVNFLKYFSECNPDEATVPDIYYKIYQHFNERILQYGIEDCCWEFPKRVMLAGGRPKGY